jgi:hypothetical protein
MDPNSIQFELNKEVLLDRLQCLIQEAIEIYGVTTDELKDLVCAVYEGTFDK